MEMSGTKNLRADPGDNRFGDHRGARTGGTTNRFCQLPGRFVC